MFLLSGSAFNAEVFSNTPPVREAYDYISFSGDCVLDGIHILDYEMDDEDIELQINVESTNLVLGSTLDLIINTTEFLSNYANEPVYGENSVICANFEDSLEAGSLITTIDLPINKYVIRRKVVGDSLNPVLVELDYERDLHTYVDYTPKNNVQYIYTVAPLFDDGVDRLEGRGLSSEEVYVSFSGWILSSLDGTTSYTFSIEIETDALKSNIGFKIFENHTKFPAYRQNNRNYLSGSLSTLPLDDNLEVSESLLQEIVDFISDGNEKMLRSQSGRSLRVITMNPAIKYMDKVADQPATLTFDFIEVSEA